MPRLPPHTFYTDLPILERHLVSSLGTCRTLYMLQTLVDRTAYIKTVSFLISFSFGKNQKSKGDRSGLYGG
jgi:hypothetical protein